jgi:hypothetical protein
MVSRNYQRNSGAPTDIAANLPLATRPLCFYSPSKQEAAFDTIFADSRFSIQPFKGIRRGSGPF